MKLLTDEAKGWLIVCGVFAVPALGIGIAVAIDDPPPPPQAAAPAPAPLPAPTTPPTPTVPVPPLDSPEACALGAPPQPGLGAECERRRQEEIDRYVRETMRKLERQGVNHGGGGGGTWSPRGPSSPRPIRPYPALPGDPNDRDHDGRACESGCIN